MFTKTFAALLMLFILSIIPMSTLARESSRTTTPTPVQDFNESEQDAIFQEIKVVFANVQISVRDVIKIAEARASVAQVVDVSFEGRADRSAYRVITYQHDEIGDTIDASTGNIIGDGIVVPVSTLEVKDKTMLGGFSKTGIDLSEVVPIAEAYDLPGGSCY